MDVPGAQPSLTRLAQDLTALQQRLQHSQQHNQRQYQQPQQQLRVISGRATTSGAGQARAAGLPQSYSTHPGPEILRSGSHELYLPQQPASNGSASLQQQSQLHLSEPMQLSHALPRQRLMLRDVYQHMPMTLAPAHPVSDMQPVAQASSTACCVRPATQQNPLQQWLAERSMAPQQLQPHQAMQTGPHVQQHQQLPSHLQHVQHRTDLGVVRHTLVLPPQAGQYVAHVTAPHSWAHGQPVQTMVLPTMAASGPVGHTPGHGFTMGGHQSVLYNSVSSGMSSMTMGQPTLLRHPVSDSIMQMQSGYSAYDASDAAPYVQLSAPSINNMRGYQAVGAMYQASSVMGPVSEVGLPMPAAPMRSSSGSKRSGASRRRKAKMYQVLNALKAAVVADGQVDPVAAEAAAVAAAAALKGGMTGMPGGSVACASVVQAVFEQRLRQVLTVNELLLQQGLSLRSQPMQSGPPCGVNAAGTASQLAMLQQQQVLAYSQQQSRGAVPSSSCSAQGAAATQLQRMSQGQVAMGTPAALMQPGCIPDTGPTSIGSTGQQAAWAAHSMLTHIIPTSRSNSNAALVERLQLCPGSATSCSGTPSAMAAAAAQAGLGSSLSAMAFDSAPANGLETMPLGVADHARLQLLLSMLTKMDKVPNPSGAGPASDGCSLAPAGKDLAAVLAAYASHNSDQGHLSSAAQLPMAAVNSQDTALWFTTGQAEGGTEGPDSQLSRGLFSPGEDEEDDEDEADGAFSMHLLGSALLGGGSEAAQSWATAQSRGARAPDAQAGGAEAQGQLQRSASHTGVLYRPALLDAMGHNSTVEGAVPRLEAVSEGCTSLFTRPAAPDQTALAGKAPAGTQQALQALAAATAGQLQSWAGAHRAGQSTQQHLQGLQLRLNTNKMCSSSSAISTPGPLHSLNSPRYPELQPVLSQTDPVVQGMDSAGFAQALGPVGLRPLHSQQILAADTVHGEPVSSSIDAAVARRQLRY